MSRLFYLIPSLPILQFGVKPDIDTFSFLEQAFEHLGKEGKKALDELRMIIDIDNIKRLFRKEPIDLRGNLSQEALELAILHGSHFPQFVHDFLDRYESIDERLTHFGLVYAKFFQWGETVQNRYVRNYFSFERGLRLCLAAFRAIKLKADMSYELRFEDPQDFLVALLLAQKDQQKLQFPPEFEFLEEKLSQQNSVIDQFLFTQKLRFSKAQELVCTDRFSTEMILSYFLQLLIVEDVEMLHTHTAHDTLEEFL